jgi:uncharacterized protein YpuA (DUF1002 family)
MLIYNGNGVVIDEDMSSKKLVAILDNAFFKLAVNSKGRYTKEVSDYAQLYNIEITECDLARALDLNARIKAYHSRLINLYDLEYHHDSIAVVFGWIFKYRSVYVPTRRREAFDEFKSAIAKHNAKSVLKVNIEALETLFNYVFNLGVDSLGILDEKAVHDTDSQATLA